MARIEAKIDDRDVRKKLKQLRELVTPEALKTPLERAALFMLRRTDLRFRAQTGPDGQAWKPLAPATIRRRRKKGIGAKILQDTGRLRMSVSPKRGEGSILRHVPYGVLVGTNLKYANAHQFGHTYEVEARTGQVGLRARKNGTLITRWRKKQADGTWKTRGGARFGRDGRHKYLSMRQFTVAAHTRVLPARPYLGINQDDKQGINRIFIAWSNEKLK